MLPPHFVRLAVALELLLSFSLGANPGEQKDIGLPPEKNKMKVSGSRLLWRGPVQCMRS